MTTSHYSHSQGMLPITTFNLFLDSSPTRSDNSTGVRTGSAAQSGVFFLSREYATKVYKLETMSGVCVWVPAQIYVRSCLLWSLLAHMQIWSRLRLWLDSINEYRCCKRVKQASAHPCGSSATNTWHFGRWASASAPCLARAAELWWRLIGCPWA